MNTTHYQKTRANFEHYLKSKHYAKTTIETYLKTTDIYFKWLEKENLEAAEITYNDLLLFMKQCSNRSASQRTIKYYMSILKNFYEHLIAEGQIVTNPVSDIKVQGVKRKTLYHILQPHELHTLYNQYQEDSLSGKRNKIMLGLLVYQGLTTGELIKLSVKDVKLRAGQIDIPGDKRSNQRVLQLESHQILDMYDYVLQTRPEIVVQSGQDSNQLLLSTGRNPKLRKVTQAIMKKLKKINPNTLNTKQIRASVITKWLKTHNLREVQYLAGHRYISSTESYLQNDMEGLQEEINQFHPLG